MGVSGPRRALGCWFTCWFRGKSVKPGNLPPQVSCLHRPSTQFPGCLSLTSLVRLSGCTFLGSVRIVSCTVDFSCVLRYFGVPRVISLWYHLLQVRFKGPRYKNRAGCCCRSCSQIPGNDCTLNCASCAVNFF